MRVAECLLIFDIILSRGIGRPIALTGRSQYCLPARAVSWLVAHGAGSCTAALDSRGVQLERSNTTYARDATFVHTTAKDIAGSLLDVLK